MTERFEVDALVVGGGMAGLAMTARLAVDGRSVLCIETGARPAKIAIAHDRRTTAILQPGIETLVRSGAWETMAAEAQAMHGLRIIDCGGLEQEPGEEVLFEAEELGDEPFGWNVENARARLAIADRIDALANARLLTETRIVHWVARRDAVLATLDNGCRVRARLIIGADGRHSTVRDRAGIAHRTVEYRQKALSCRVSHTMAHDGISTEMHHVGGPLTFAPLPGNNSGVVWMAPNAEADRLNALDDAAFLAELNAWSHGVLGEIEMVAERGAFPAASTVAVALTARRTVLVAEAAHAFPPIGAQGFNLSLRDVETLAGLVKEADDPGDSTVLKRYSRRRRPDIYARMAGIDLLNRSVLSALRPVRDFRRTGLGVLARNASLRRFAMHVGMGR